MVIADVAIDTKYRFGSGDSSTVRHLADSANRLRGLGFRPVMLILRADSLGAALRRFRSSGWEVTEAAESFDFLAGLCPRAPGLEDLLSDLDRHQN